MGNAGAERQVQRMGRGGRGEGDLCVHAGSGSLQGRVSRRGEQKSAGPWVRGDSWEGQCLPDRDMQRAGATGVSAPARPDPLVYLN